MKAKGAEGARKHESHPTNDIPNKYIYDVFSMIYLIYIAVLTSFKGVNQGFKKAVIMQFCKTVKKTEDNISN